MRGIILVVMFFAVRLVGAGEEPWSMNNSRNMMSSSTGLPCSLVEENVKWKIRTGSHQYTIPVIDGDRLYLGLNDALLSNDSRYKSTRGGMVMCVSRATGETLWRLPIPRYLTDRPDAYHFNCFHCGICSSPVVDGKRIYVIGSRAQVLCIDREGMGDGNDGPFTDENGYLAQAMQDGSPGETTVNSDGDIIWLYDMIKELNVFPHDVCGSTILMHGEFLYVCTGNGKAIDHETTTNPDAPSLIVLSRKDGRLVAVEKEGISAGTFHGQWASASSATVEGRPLIFFGGGDGRCYAFEAVKKTGQGIDTLKLAWSYDCNANQYRINDDGSKALYAAHNRKIQSGPSEVIGTPVFYSNCVYVAIGQSPYHGVGQGMLSCLDALTGKKIWDSDLVKRSTATVAIQNGLLFISDYSSNLHCFNAETGERHWVHDLEAGVWAASPFVADGKVYIGTEKNVFWILEAAKTKKVLYRENIGSMPISVTAETGILYLPTQNSLTVYSAR